MANMAKHYWKPCRLSCGPCHLTIAEITPEGLTSREAQRGILRLLVYSSCGTSYMLVFIQRLTPIKPCSSQWTGFKLWTGIYQPYSSLSSVLRIQRWAKQKVPVCMEQVFIGSGIVQVYKNGELCIQGGLLISRKILIGIESKAEGWPRDPRTLC